MAVHHAYSHQDHHRDALLYKGVELPRCGAGHILGVHTHVIGLEVSVCGGAEGRSAADIARQGKGVSHKIIVHVWAVQSAVAAVVEAGGGGGKIPSRHGGFADLIPIVMHCHCKGGDLTAGGKLGHLVDDGETADGMAAPGLGGGRDPKARSNIDCRQQKYGIPL